MYIYDYNIYIYIVILFILSNTHTHTVYIIYSGVIYRRFLYCEISQYMYMSKIFTLSCLNTILVSILYNILFLIFKNIIKISKFQSIVIFVIITTILSSTST
jgi:hypothetical protein